jgi:hypothetical protein
MSRRPSRLALPALMACAIPCLVYVLRPSPHPAPAAPRAAVHREAAARAPEPAVAGERGARGIGVKRAVLSLFLSMRSLDHQGRAADACRSPLRRGCPP